MKLKFTRNKLIAICVVVCFCFISLFVALSIDASYTLFKSSNPIALMAKAMGFPEFKPISQTWIMLCFLLIWLIVYVVSVCFINSYAKAKEENPLAVKYIFFYVGTFFICLILSLGIASLFFIPNAWSYYSACLAYVFETFFFALLIMVFLGLLCFAIVGLFLNIKNYHKPLYALSEKKVVEDNYDHSLKETFAIPEDKDSKVASAQVALSSNVPNTAPLKDKAELFRGLTKIDSNYFSHGNLNLESSLHDLKTICDDLQVYLANSHNLYYDIANLRAFVAGLACSSLIILEGVSGTGKSSLPRYFAEFIGEESFFEAIQATYRDKSNLLGYYNEFTNTYMETDFLKSLYKASCYPNHINLIVLDEMNISRVEYYFADFLSVLEYPELDRKIRLMELPEDYKAPNNLKDGLLFITPNNYFIGTCNKDDSTYTLTDKVIDRAIVITFNDYGKEVHYNKEVNPIILTNDELKKLYKEALTNKELALSDIDSKKVYSLIDKIQELFDITIGNRILKQLNTFVPVYMACGGTKDMAIDFMFSTKILRKLDSHFEMSFKQSLTKFKKYLTTDLGLNMPNSIAIVDKYLHKLE